MSFHQTLIQGRLSRDPEVRYTTSGQAVANLSIPVDDKVKDNVYTTWYRVQVWGKLAELAGEYLKKGSEVLIVGRMSVRKYEKDGVEREVWELVANTMKFVGGGKKSGGSTDTSSATCDDGPGPDFSDEDIPF